MPEKLRQNQTLITTKHFAFVPFYPSQNDNNEQPHPLQSHASQSHLHFPQFPSHYPILIPLP